MVKSILVKIGVAILVIALVDLVYVNYLVLVDFQKNTQSEAEQNSSRTIKAEETPVINASPSPEANITTQTSPAVTPSPTTIYQTQVQEKTVVQTAQKEIFVPIGSGSTYSNSYANLSGVEVKIDWSKYSGIESVVFEATIWVQGGNGRAYAQLVNITDNNPLNESTLSSSSGGGEFKYSGNIPISSGIKTYGVRAKTDIVEFAAHVDNAKIKITLK